MTREKRLIEATRKSISIGSTISFNGINYKVERFDDEGFLVLVAPNQITRRYSPFRLPQWAVI